MKKRKILFITGSRSDFYIQKPILDAVKKSNFLSLLLIVAGSHLSKKFGFTINEILKEKYNIVAKIKNLVVSDNPLARLKSASKQLSKLVEVISRTKPDIMIAPFDREESITIAVAGAYTNTPVVHLGAGDRTRFNIDGIIVKERHFPIDSKLMYKSASGCMEHINILTVSNINTTLKYLREKNFWVYGFDAKADKNFTEIDWKGSAILLFGSEGFGMKKHTEKYTDFLVKININQNIESLNISNSAAIVFHHINEQKKT